MNGLILNLDHSVRGLAGVNTIDATAWQARIRYGCSHATLRRFSVFLAQSLAETQSVDSHSTQPRSANTHGSFAQSPFSPGTVLLGSGDFHHLSLPLIARTKSAHPLRIVVFDNHPDNMRFPFGVHCGSWVRAAAALPNVAHIHMVGMTSADMSAKNAWSHYLAPLRAGKLSYWSLNVDTQWARWLGLSHAFHSFSNTADLLHALESVIRQQKSPTYLSIDKDVLRKSVVQTNWDQGVFELDDLTTAIGFLNDCVVGSDITGEISTYRYSALWKRLLTRLDGQGAEPDRISLVRFQEQQAACNAVLMTAIHRAYE